MDPAFSTTGERAAAIRAREVSAVELLDAQIGRLERHDRALNAVVTRDLERARARAREADEALARGITWGPLHGVAFTLKDTHATAGVRTTTGFPPLADHVPAEDGTVAARMKAAGGILLGKTNVAEMLADYQSSNPIFGRSNNPWNLERTPGGSSGGAAAAVAAGLTPFDVGTDMAGSIRVPAHFCGVFGLKPTENRVSLAGVVPGLPIPRPVRIMSCVGPLARTVEDLALLFGLLAGPDGRDTEIAPVPIGEPPALDLTGLRIAVARTFPGFPVAARVAASVDDLGKRLARAGARVHEATLPPLDFAEDGRQTGALIGMMMGAFQPQAGGPPTPLADYLTALHRRDRSILAWDGFFDSCDALLCPPAMVPAFAHCPPGTPIDVDGTPADYGLLGAHTALFNYSGHPAVVLPHQLDGDRLPVGVQLVAKRWDDARLLAVARAVAQVSGPFQTPPGFA